MKNKKFIVEVRQDYLDAMRIILDLKAFKNVDDAFILANLIEIETISVEEITDE